MTADLFERGLCLPSGAGMTDADLERVISVIERTRIRLHRHWRSVDFTDFHDITTFESR